MAFGGFVGLLIWRWGGSSEAAGLKPLPNASCGRARATAVSKAFEYLNKIDDAAPIVPSDQASYFETESAALRQGDDAKGFNAMVSRPYYYPWELRRATTRARDRLMDVRMLPINASPKAHIQASARTDLARAEVWNAWTEYNQSPAGNSLPSNVVRDTSYYAASLAGVMGEYEWCWAYLLPGK
jgi:hypothetical protein